ncbi:response regulator [Marivirga lumbricoides]|uniref:Response regulator n=1 Tax=Marivirga lumbricoides TaxID=1046115 RepID=A0ABQ1N1H5_9BACT|nr:response regulator [Marivirga lumbricoides]
MKKKLNCILFIDDDEAVNFLHQHYVEEAQIAEKTVTKQNGKEAIDFLSAAVEGKYEKPDLIFLDINMPVMSGWEFIKEYNELPAEAKGKIVLFMLTTSLNPEDRVRAEREASINGFETKPLDAELLKDIMKEYFPDHV